MTSQSLSRPSIKLGPETTRKSETLKIGSILLSHCRRRDDDVQEEEEDFEDGNEKKKNTKNGKVIIRVGKKLLVRAGFLGPRLL